MKEEAYKKAIQNTPDAFAYLKAKFDQTGSMTDCVVLEVNDSFETLTGFDKQGIIGKSFLEDVSRDKEHAKEWIKTFEQVFLVDYSIEFEKLYVDLNKYYKVRAFAIDGNSFVAFFTDITFERKMESIVDYLAENMGKNINYDELSRFAREITGAAYAALNIFDDNFEDFTTVSIAGEPQNIEKAVKLVNFNPLGKKWNNNPVREKKISKNIITYFDSLHELVGDVLPEIIVEKLERKFKIGNIVVAKIVKGEKAIGDFTVIFKAGDQLRNSNLFKIYLSQVALLIEKTNLEKSLILNQRQLYTLAEYAPVGFMACDRNGKIIFANKKLLEFMDSPSYKATKAINLFEFTPLRKNGFSDKLRKCINKDDSMTFETEYESIWGKKSWFKVHINTNRENDRVIGANIVIDDISKEKLREEALKDRVNRDALTQAYNRHALETTLPERLQKDAKRNMTACFALLDIDDFKNINDTYGHTIGDRILMYISLRIKRELRKDDLLIRTGGDEFLIYLHDIGDETEAEHVIGRIFNKISSHYMLEDIFEEKKLNIFVGCSMGVVFYPKHGEDVVKLIAKADEALYRAKANGKAEYIIAK